MSSCIDLDDSPCRICLTEGAHIPIFEKFEGTSESIQLKILKCINQKVEDIMGYPRKICTQCNTTLDSIVDFIEIYINTCKVLEKLDLHNVKQEIFLQDEYDTIETFHEEYLESSEDETGKENGTLDIKLEPEITEELDKAEHFKKLLNLDLKIKKIKFEPLDNDSKSQKSKKLVSKSKTKNKTNKIASAILEGKFEWIDSKWCLISSTTIKKVKTNKTSKKIRFQPNVSKKNKKVPHREPEIKIPKDNGPPEPKLCDHCGKTFTNINQFRRHKELHREYNPEKCPQCDYTSKRREYLKRHILYKHTPRKYVCDLCGGKFPLKNILNKHIKIVHHKQKKLYPCTMCDKKYLAPQSIEAHIRSVHTGDRPAICTVCDKAFYTDQYLKEHMRLHTGETPFHCPVCGRGYAQRGNMKSHIRHNHRISQLTSEQLEKIKPIYLKVMKD